jgi:uncharacterized protein (TIGR04255 family)
MGRRYSKSPIIEAVCEFRFEPGEWDSAMFGLVWKKVAEVFEERRDVQAALQLELVPTSEGTQQRLVPEPRPRMQYLSKDGRLTLVMGPDVLSVNRLAPYSSWEEFKPIVRQGFDAYVSSVAPKVIRRTGLRYINRIEFPGERIELDEYLNFRPFLGPTLPQDHASFIAGVEFVYQPEKDLLRLQLASVPPAKEQLFAVILDLDHFSPIPGSVPVKVQPVVDWLDRAHERVESVFEGTITDRLRLMFGEEV